MRWLDELKAAFDTLGGAARYSDLYEYVARTTNRALTAEWKATVRRTIEDHSSDSLNHRAEDVFKKLGHGHWGLRQAEIPLAELKRRENMTPQEVVKEVLVREHWRSLPSKQLDVSDFPKDERLSPESAWCTNSHLEVELVSGTKISSPIAWYPKLLAATPLERSKVEISPDGLRWSEIGEYINIQSMLLGKSCIAPRALEE